MTVALPGLEILGRPLDGARPDGVYLGPGGFSGWDDGVEMRRETVQRVAAAGDFDATGYPDARIVSLSGVIASPSEERTQYWMDRLTGVLNDGSMGRITVGRADVTRFATAGLVRTTAEARKHAPSRADWQMQLWCPNPRKYGHLNQEVSANDGSFITTHRGNARALTRFVVAGTGDRWRITGPGGRSILVTQALRSGSPHEYDMLTGQLRVGGVLTYGGVETADTWSIPQARTLNHTLSVQGGSATATAYTFDTYL